MTITVHSKGHLPIYQYIRKSAGSFTFLPHESPVVFKDQAIIVPNPVHISPEDQIQVVAKPEGQPDQSFKGHTMQPGDKFVNFFDGYPLVECK